MFRFLRRRARDIAPAFPTSRPYPSAATGRRRTPIPDRVGRIYVPLAVLEATHNVMHRFGNENRECYVWWGGYFTSDGNGQVVTALHPEIATEYGRVHLQTAALERLHWRLRELDQVLLVELHTHPPGAGGQNDVDAAHPAATYQGFMSIVVPDFAKPRFYDIRKSHVYAYLNAGQWRTLDMWEIAERFAIEETSLGVEL